MATLWQTGDFSLLSYPFKHNHECSTYVNQFSTEIGKLMSKATQ